MAAASSVLLPVPAAPAITARAPSPRRVASARAFSEASSCSRSSSGAGSASPTSTRFTVYGVLRKHAYLKLTKVQGAPPMVIASRPGHYLGAMGPVAGYRVAGAHAVYRTPRDCG